MRAPTHLHIKSIGQRSLKKSDSEGKNDFSPAYANGGELEDRRFPDPYELGISPSERTKRKIVRHLEGNGMMEAESISENAVKRIIAMIAGHDKRTVDKYFHILEEECLLPENMKRIYPQRLERYPHLKR